MTRPFSLRCLRTSLLFSVTLAVAQYSSARPPFRRVPLLLGRRVLAFRKRLRLDKTEIDRPAQAETSRIAGVGPARFDHRRTGKWSG